MGRYTEKKWGKIYSSKEKNEDVQSNTSCKFVLFSSPEIIIDFNNEKVYNFFRSKFNGINISQNKIIKLHEVEQYLPFYVFHMEPEETAKIDNDTIISFIYLTKILDNKYDMAMAPTIPDLYLEHTKSKLSNTLYFYPPT